MPHIEAAGIQVNFPFDPYPCQVAYMEKMIQTLRLGQNAILESPTGTGKTLCLLCSSLAWLENKKAQVSNQRMRLAGSEAGPGEALNEFRETLTGQLDNAAGVWEGELAAPKIIFASRTHSQLTQAIQEMKRTAYRHFKTCVLGSREQLCIHPQVMKEESNSAKVHLCRAKVQNRSCHFYNQLEAAKSHFANQVLDIEDLVTLGQKHNCCPYYAAREMKAEADIIFMPYNYLLDVKSRRAHGVELKGNIVIFDEAHNLEKICEDSASFDLSSADIASAMRELSELSDKVLEWVKEEEMGATNLSDSQMAISQDFTLKELLQLKAMLADLEEQIDAIPLPKPQEGVTKPGSFIFDIMRRINLTFETKIAVLELVEKTVTHLTNETSSGIFHSRGAGLSKFADVIKLVFSRDLEDVNAMAYHQTIVSKYYKVHVRQEEPKKSKKSDGWGSVANSGKIGRILSYWCFSPGHAMEDLRAHGVKSIILTSGTLSPLSSFKTEMGIKFHVELENPHVIEKHQVWIGTVSKGPDGSLLNSSYQNRFKTSYQSSIGNAVVNFARVVPNGLLIFFPSYSVMDTCLEHWQSTGIWSRIEQYKPIFVEPRHKAEFQTAMLNFYEKINDPTLNGAIFAAVCRGKVSEGLDFSDNNGRAVVITGLPFPPRMDPKVMLKMQFLDELRRQGSEGLTGQEWYRQQATRAVNQAIGRVIRHKQDFGAILLCDNRFASASSRNELPIWVRPAVTNYSAFGLALRDLMVFFKTAEKLVPAPGPPKERVVPPAARGSSGAYFMPTITRTSSGGPGGVMRASAVVDHAPSLRRRPAINEGMSLAKLRVEYEASKPDNTTSSSAGNKKGARNLLDALSTNEKRSSTELTHHSDTQIPSYQTELRASQSQAKGKKKIVIKKTGNGSDVRKDTLQSAEAYLSEVKRTLSSQSYAYFSTTLADYRKTEDFLKMVSCLAEIFTSNSQSHHLFRRFYRFVRPQHKERFDQTCKDLIGQGCGFTPKDAIPKKRQGSEEASGGQGKRAKLETAKTACMDTKSTEKSNISSGNPSLGSSGQSGPSTSGGFTSNPVRPSTASASLPGTGAVSKSAQGSVPTPDDSRCITAQHGELGPSNKPVQSAASASECGVYPDPQKQASTIATGKAEAAVADGKENSVEVGPLVEERGVANSTYQHGQQDLGFDCCRCHQVAKIPFKAPCEHVCCVRCWKEAINETKACPKCGAKVKKKNLTQVCFGSRTAAKQ